MAANVANSSRAVEASVYVVRAFVRLREMIASNKGLGYLVQRAGSEFDTAGAFAALIVIALIAVILNEFVQTIQTRLERWKIVSR